MNYSPSFTRKIMAAGMACLALALGNVACRPPAPGNAPTSASVLPPVPAGPDDVFEDVTAKAGITFVHQHCDNRIANIIESNGSGAVVFDYDHDGLMDIYFVNAGPLDGVTHHPPGTPRQPNRLYRNRGDGTFEDVTQKAGVAGAGYGTAVVAADYDNDGFTDLYVVTVGKSILYHNKGNGTFEDVTDKAGVANNGTGLSAVFLDFDNDGLLDLFVANYLTYDPNYKLYFNPDAYPGPLSYKPEYNKLYRNKGDGTFEDVSEKAGIRLPGHRAMSVSAFDYNQDGFVDLYLSNDATPNTLLVNDGKGHFQEQALKLGVAFNALGEAAGSMAAAVGDCNNDGIADILVTRLGYGSLYMGTSSGHYDDRMMASGLGGLTAQFVGWGGAFLDYNNDGNLDIFIANGDAHYLVGWEPLLLENRGDATFADAAKKGGAIFNTRLRGRGSAILDYDNDGRQDILVTCLADRPVLMHNRDKSGNKWITLALEGTKSNRDGFGALVTVKAGGRTYVAEHRCPVGFLSEGDPRLHFGLGQAASIESIEIRWPSGQKQPLANVEANKILKVREPGERK